MKTTLVILYLIFLFIGYINAQQDVSTSPFFTSTITKQETSQNSLTNYQRDEDTLHYDAMNSTGLGASAGGLYYPAVRFTSTQACTVKSILFYHYDTIPHGGYVYLRNSGGTMAPGPILESVPYNAVTEGWFRINFSSVYVFPIGLDFWLVVGFNHLAGEHPIGADAGPRVPERNFRSFDGGATWSELTLTNNYNIRAIVKYTQISTDVGVEVILNPTAFHYTNTLMNPQARVRNYSTTNQVFPVICSIINASGITRYTNTQTISLASLRDTTVTFSSWIPTVAESLTVIMRTALGGDSVFVNDRKTRTTIVVNTQQVIIGTGTATQRFPLAMSYGYERSASLYLGREINLTGIITDLSWYINTLTNHANGPVKIYLKNTTDTAFIFAGIWQDMITNATLVYDNSAVFTAGGWYPFMTDFFNHTGDNLLVLVETNYGGSGGEATAAKAIRYTATSPNNRHQYWYANTSPPTNTGIRTLYRPNIRISIATAPACDVGVHEILSPIHWQFPNALMTPIAKVKNYGSASQTFPVICSIINSTGQIRHLNTQTISLAPQRDTTVTFTSWTPTNIETLTVIMQTNLLNDSTPANDRKTRTTKITNSAEVIIGTGTISSVFFPFYGYYNYSVSEAIYLQSEINYYGNITNLAYFKGIGTDTTPIPNLNIYFKHTSEETLTTGIYDTSGYTQVYNGSIINNAFDWMDITLDRPFIYNNTDNLRILVIKNPPGISYGYPYYRSTSTSLFSRLRYGYGDIMPTSLTRSLNRSNIRLYIDTETGINEENINNQMNPTMLYPIQPNPIKNDKVKISFSIASPTNLSLKIYDASGKLIKTLANAFFNSGNYHYLWNGDNVNNHKIAEGIYFCTLKTDKQNFTKKIIFTR